MWTIKRFKSYEKQAAWIVKHEHLYQIVVLFVNNAYALEVKRLRIL